MGSEICSSFVVLHSECVQPLVGDEWLQRGASSVVAASDLQEGLARKRYRKEVSKFQDEKGQMQVRLGSGAESFG